MENEKYNKLKEYLIKYLHFIISSIFLTFFYVIFGDDKNYNYFLDVGYFKMLAISVGIFSLLAYINDYINQKAKEFADKSEYYYGVNISEDSFYNRFEFKLFLNARLELFLTILVIIPALLILSSFTYHSNFFINIFKLLDYYKRLIFSVWSSIFVLIFIYLVIILNGIFSESRKSFYDGYRIDTDKLITYDRKSEVNKKITEEYTKRLKDIIDECKEKETGTFKRKVSLLTNDVLLKANLLSKNEEEFFVYILNTYLSTGDTLLDLIDFEADNEGDLVMIRDYYLGKWDPTMIIRFRNYTNAFFFIAIIDLENIGEIITRLKDKKLVDSIFKGRNEFENFFRNSEVMNVVVGRIVYMLGIKTMRPDYTNYESFIYDFFTVPTILYNLNKDGVINRNDFQILINYMHECLCKFALIKEPSLSYILDDLEDLYKHIDEYQIFIDSLTEMKEKISN